MLQSTDGQPVDSEPQLVTELRSELAAAQQSWSEEKQCLQSSVESLKKLLTQIQVHSNVSNTNYGDCVVQLIQFASNCVMRSLCYFRAF